MDNEEFLVVSKHPYIEKIGGWASTGAFGSFMLAAAMIFASINYKTNKIYLILNSFHMTALFIAAFVICFITSTLLKKLFLQKPEFDDWIWNIASKRVGSSYAIYDKDYLYIDYDVAINPKELKDFVIELNDKSVDYSYYIGNNDINQALFAIKPTKREPLPTSSILNIKEDKNWNIIPVGVAVNHELQTISPITWKLNDTIEDKTVIDTQPSTSLLVSGGTGSGKSVFENAIIGHLSRYEDRFQAIACDVKVVEFIRLENLKSIKKIALTVEEVADAIHQAQSIMKKRFDMMGEHRVNNIYNIEGIECDCYELNGKTYQFDEIFPCSVDGKKSILQISEIFEALEEGKDIEIISQMDR